jgi:protein-disulfide isomerase
MGRGRNMARRRLVGVGLMLALLAGGPIRAQGTADDPVKAALEQAAQAAAAARVRDLLQDPASPVIGPADADVAIVEFFDYQCPYCKAAEPRLEALLQEDRGVRLVLKEFPILTPESRVASKAALASVKQDKYTAFHQALLGYRGQLKEATIFEIAAAVGLDVPRLRKDMDSPEVADQIIATMNLARALKISVVPGFLVDTHVLSGVSNKTETGKIDFKQEVAAARARKAK